ncbi:MAG TPA: hypothetical protein VIM38_12350 [Alphaproteobacteria bacterium]
MAPAKKAAPLKATARRKATPRPQPSLERAFKRAAKLSPKAQKALAACLLEQLDIVDDEARWMASFAATQEQLNRWAEEAMKDIELGNTTPLDFDRRGR